MLPQSRYKSKDIADITRDLEASRDLVSKKRVKISTITKINDNCVCLVSVENHKMHMLVSIINKKEDNVFVIPENISTNMHEGAIDTKSYTAYVLRCGEYIWNVYTNNEDGVCHLWPDEDHSPIPEILFKYAIKGQ